jgi:hypothetical protein
VTVFFQRGVSAYIRQAFKKIDRSSAIVAETEQIPNRRNSPLNSRVQISDGSGSRFFVVQGKTFVC